MGEKVCVEYMRRARGKRGHGLLWIELEKIILNEVTQTSKHIHVMYALKCGC